jgi:hypothetical protein
VRPLDVGHCSGMKIQPLLAKDRVPAPADEEIDHHQNPNREMIDLRVHNRTWSIIRWLELGSQADSSRSSDVDLKGWECGPHCDLPR